MIIETWFPTPVSYSFAPEQIKNSIKSEYLANEENIISKLDVCNQGDNLTTTYGKTVNLIEEHNLIILKNFIESSVREFCKHLYADTVELNIRDSWVNYFNPGQYEERHCHTPALISGVYYLKTNGKDGNLTIFPSTIGLESSGPKPTQLGYSSVEYGPEEGKLILFPSWVPHAVKMNKTQDTRISIAFNLTQQ
jgi:uncharacterized protein (TIGR02466 family)